MKKLTLLALLLGSISTTSIAYDAVNSPYNENPVWLKRELSKEEFLEAMEFVTALMDEATNDMLNIPSWNGMGSNENFARHIELKERYTCQLELASYEYLRLLQSQVVYHPESKGMNEAYKDFKKIFNEMVGGKDPDTYTIQECKASDSWFPM